MVIELRTITAGDWHVLREVSLRALEDAPDAFRTVFADAASLSDDTWRERAGSPGLTLIAFEGGAAVAMGGVAQPNGFEEPHIWGMWTAPEARGRGTAGVLLDALVDWCRPSFDFLFLHVTEGNGPARRLYVARGFEATGNREPLREGSGQRVEEMRLELAGHGSG